MNPTRRKQKGKGFTDLLVCMSSGCRREIKIPKKLKKFILEHYGDTDEVIQNFKKGNATLPNNCKILIFKLEKVKP